MPPPPPVVSLLLMILCVAVVVNVLSSDKGNDRAPLPPAPPPAPPPAADAAIVSGGGRLFACDGELTCSGDEIPASAHLATRCTVLPDSILHDIRVELFDNKRPLKIKRRVSGERAGADDDEDEDDDDDDKDDDDEVVVAVEVFDSPSDDCCCIKVDEERSAVDDDALLSSLSLIEDPVKGDSSILRSWSFLATEDAGTRSVAISRFRSKMVNADSSSALLLVREHVKTDSSIVLTRTSSENILALF